MYGRGSNLLYQPIILLKSGTEASSGKQLILSNIRACVDISEILRTTLGPMGRDKLINVNNKTHITNDGATIIELLQIVHPAASILVDIAKSQDAQIGDGTTSVVVLAGAFLEQTKILIEDNVQPQTIIIGYRLALEYIIKYINDICINIKSLNKDESKSIIVKCAETSLSSKLLAFYKTIFSEFAYQAVINMATHNNNKNFSKEYISIKKVRGGSITDSMFINGVAFQKCFSYAGFENAPKCFTNGCKVLLLHIELELKAEKENAEVRVDNVKDYQSMIDAEWQILQNKLDTIVQSGCNVCLSRLSIGDVATQYLADNNIFCAGRVEAEDMTRTMLATDAKILSTLNDFDAKNLGNAEKFEEIQIGNERFNIFHNCSNRAVSTIILRGGAHEYIDEAERSLHDAIMVCHRTYTTNTVVGGGGAIEIALHTYLMELSSTITTKFQIIFQAFAKALESIPRNLAENSGFDVNETIMKLFTLHYSNKEKNLWKGVDCLQLTNDTIMDSHKAYVWEPTINKVNCYSSAIEAACAILSVDEMIKNPKSNPDPKN